MPIAPKRILIVEDEAISAMAMQHMVELTGHQVVGTVDTGEAAIAVAVAERPDLVLMDIRLKTAMPGTEAAAQIFAQAGIRSVFVTAYQARESDAPTGVDDLPRLVKPVLQEDLEGVLDQLFGAD